MTVGTLDRRNAILLVGGVAAVLLLRFVVMTDHSSAPAVVGSTETTAMAEERLIEVFADPR